MGTITIITAGITTVKRDAVVNTATLVGLMVRFTAASRHPT